METTAIASTTLTSVAYDEGKQLLELVFRSRAVYRYFDVPARVHAGLLNSASKGAYFNEAIRGRYRFARVPEARG
jgi:hypothetical protein